MACLWCGSEEIGETTKDCCWVMPDGRRAVQILQVPAVECPHCGVYVSEQMNQKVEEALYIADLSGLSDRFAYEALLKAPTISLFQLK